MEEGGEKKRKPRNAGESGARRQSGQTAGQGEAHPLDLAEKIQEDRHRDQRVGDQRERSRLRGIVCERDDDGKGHRHPSRGARAGGAVSRFHPPFRLPGHRLPEGGVLRPVLAQEPELRGDTRRGVARGENPFAGRAPEHRDPRRLEIDRRQAPIAPGTTEGGRGGANPGKQRPGFSLRRDIGRWFAGGFASGGRGDPALRQLPDLPVVEPERPARGAAIDLPLLGDDPAHGGNPAIRAFHPVQYIRHARRRKAGRLSCLARISHRVP